jgi:hypothetical protein
MKVRCTEVQLVLKWGGNLTKLGTSTRFYSSRPLQPVAYPDSSDRGKAVDTFGAEAPS